MLDIRKTINNIRCRLGFHDWKYYGKTYHTNHETCFDLTDQRICKICGIEEHGNFLLVGPYPCSYKEREKNE